jgi:hypothetical protein
MDPLNITSALALLLLQKAAGKIGEKIGDKISQVGDRLWTLLEEKSVQTTIEIKKLSESVDSLESLSSKIENSDTMMILNNMQQLVANDDDIKKAVNDAAEQWEIQSSRDSASSSKIAEKIGILNNGLIVNPVINF